MSHQSKASQLTGFGVSTIGVFNSLPQAVKSNKTEETGHVDMGSMAKVGVVTNVLAAFALWIVLRLFLPLVV